jgi:hypothetical protein
MKVLLTNQSFVEAGASAEFCDLEPVGIVQAEAIYVQGRLAARKKALEKLAKGAEECGCAAVFKVEHNERLVSHSIHDMWDCLVLGTGYKKKWMEPRCVHVEEGEEP